MTAVTRSAGKTEFARKVGADHVLVSSDEAAMASAGASFDLILNTIPINHDYDVYTKLTRRGGHHVLLGLNTGLVAGMAVDLLCCGRSKVKVSLSIAKETQLYFQLVQ